MAKLIMTEEGSTPTTPASGKWKVYPKGDGLYILDDAGIELGISYETAYKIAPSVSANDLILAIKHLDGTDPSVQRPIMVKIGNSKRLITAALSVTKADGTSWANLGSAELATKEVDLFPYLVWNTNLATDAVDIFWSRIPYGRLYSDFSGTTTNEKYAAINGTAPAATDECINIGRFAATLSAGAGYTWTVPTFTNVNLIQHPMFETRWLDYVPTWASSGTAVALGDAVIGGRYKIIQNSVKLVIFQTMGSTTTYGTGTYSWAAPFTAITWTNGVWQSSCQVVDVSPLAFYVAALRIVSAGNTISIASNSGIVGQTVPFTWASGDVMNASMLEYQIG